MVNAIIRNNHSTPLTVGGATIPPNGGQALVDGWDRVQRSNAVAIWLDAGLIEEVEGKKAVPSLPGLPGLPTPAALPPVPGLPAVDPEAAEKATIIAKLSDFGIVKTAKTSLANLRKALETAEADAEAATARNKKRKS